MRGRLICAATSVAALVVAAVQPSADARWNIHDGALGTELRPPPGGTDRQTCADRVRGRAGWYAPGQDADYVPAASTDAYRAVPYEVWRAPAGFTSFASGEKQQDEDGNVTGYLFTDPSTGDPSAATKVLEFTTPRRTLVDDPIPHGDDFVFTTARIAAPLPRSVDPGDLLGLALGYRGSPSSPLDLTVVSCAFRTRGQGFVASPRTSPRRTVARIAGPGGVDDYAATIRWGDRTRPSKGTVKRTPAGLAVTARHAYRRPGRYSVSIRVRQTATDIRRTATAVARVR
jgi:hypothetical protein